MKKCLLILLLFLACQEEEVDPRAGRGCLTGVLKGTTARMTIRCCTYDEFKTGSHFYPNWTNFTGHKWEKCDDCN